MESNQRRKIVSIEIVSFSYNLKTTESHSATCEAIHVCGVVHSATFKLLSLRVTVCWARRRLGHLVRPRAGVD